MIYTSVGRFLNVDLILNPVLSSVYTMWEPNWKPTVGSGYENRFKCIHIYNVFEEPDRFSQITQIRFSVSFIDSSCSCSHLGLLLFSCCYYFFSHTAITFLPLLFFCLYYYYCSPIITALSLLLLLFSHCSYSFPIAFTFLTWCCSFHVMKSFNH